MRKLSFLTLSVALCSCVSQRVVDDAGFHHEGYDYFVRAEGGSILPTEWMLDNYYLLSTRDKYVEKSIPSYRVTYHLDRNGDGRPDVKKEEPLYDLRFVHLNHNGVIWLRTYPMATYEHTRELRVLMRSYVENIAGTGVEAVWLSDDEMSVGKERTFASRILDCQDGTVARQKAYACTIEIGDTDQVRFDPSHVLKRARVILIRTPFGYDPLEPIRTKDSRSFGVLMMAGYSNYPSDYESGLVDFAAMLQRIAIAAQSGVQFEAPAPQAPTTRAPDATPRAVAPPVSPPPAPAVPDGAGAQPAEDETAPPP